MIVSPVSRWLGVADVNRSLTFYGGVLGFEAGPPDEVISGPACLHFYAAPVAEPAIVFFEVRDVKAWRERIVARGGKPSPLQDANWIKMRLFELRDPDGHTLWFAETFAEPIHAPPPPMLRTALPELPCSDMASAVAHYCQALGFKINYQQHDLAVLYRDAVTLLLIVRTPAHTGIGSCEFYVEDADALHAELTARGARVQGTPVSHPWGLRAFSVLDGEGNRLTFAQTFE